MKLVGMAKFHIIIGGRFYEIEPIVVANHMKQPLVGQEFCSNHNLMCGALNQKWFIKDVATSITIAEEKDVFHNINMILTQHANQKYINRIDLSQFTEVEPMAFEEISVQDQIMEAKLEWMRIENMTEEELNTLKLEDIIKEATITFEGSGTGDRIEVEPTGRVNLIADETCQQAEEIFTEEWKKMWAEKFADKNQPKIQCKPINIKGKDGVTLHGQKAHRMTKNSEKMARAKIDEMVEKKHLRPINNSPLGIPIIMVPKPGTKKMRMVVDMRLYNALMEKVNLPLPNIEMIFDKLRKIGAYLAVMDLKDGFHNVPIDQVSQDQTVIITPWGQYCYCVLPQGWHSSPGIFQSIVHEILQEAKERHELSERYVQFVDDICMGANSLEELKIKVDKFLQVIWKSGLQVNPDKCIFGATRVKFLGFIVDEDFRSLDEKIIDKLTEKIDKIINQVVNAINVSEDPHTWVKKLLGIYTFYRQFITRFTGNTRFLRRKLKEERPTLTPEDLEKIHDLNQRSKEGGCIAHMDDCLLYTSPSPRDGLLSRMPSSA